MFVSFFGLAGLQDSGMWAATGNDRDCRKVIALGFCTSAKTDPASDPSALRADASNVFSASPPSCAFSLALQHSLCPDATLHPPDI